jgi:hypothetical protein
VRLVAGHIRHQPANISRWYIGQVGGHQDQAARGKYFPHRSQQISGEKNNAAGYPVPPGIFGSHRQGCRGNIGGINRTPGQVAGQADGNGPAARSHIGKQGLPGDVPPAQNFQGHLHQQLRFRAGNEHIPGDQEVQSHKLPVARQVGHRLAGGAPAQHFLKSYPFLPG